MAEYAARLVKAAREAKISEMTPDQHLTMRFITGCRASGEDKELVSE